MDHDMKPYSNDLREKIITAYQNGEGSLRRLAQRFSVSLNFVWLLVDRFRKTGQVDPKPHGGGSKRIILGKRADTLRQLVKAHPDATLAELRERLQKATGVVVSRSTLALTLKRLGYTRKKKTLHATERDEDEDVRAARCAYREGQKTVEAGKLVFVDECGTQLQMTRTYARSPKGQRAEGAKPAHRKNVSLIGALGFRRMRTALMVEGAVDGAMFKTFVKDLLVPVLQSGDTVLLDNPNIHKGQDIELAIGATGATLQYLPAYSPDLSPIEACWSKVKESLRSAGARTFLSLQKALKRALDQITESDIKGWFQHCGYCIAPQ
jgi:transposase